MDKILFILAINHYTGVTTWARDLIKGLSDYYTIDILFNNKNAHLISNKEYTRDIAQYANNVYINQHVSEKYKLAILHNSYHESLSKKLAKKTMFVSHSSLVDSCIPKLKHDLHVAVSKLTYKVLDADLYIQNTIDTEHFKRGVKPFDSKIRCLYHNRVAPQQIVVEACDTLGITLDYWVNIEKDVRPKINKADFVIAYGRSAYEAMSMSKPVLVFGHNSLDTHRLEKNGISVNQGGLCDGWITKNNFNDLLYRNCSGYHKQDYLKTKEDLLKYISTYDHSAGRVNREIIIKSMPIKHMISSFQNAIKSVVL